MLRLILVISGLRAGLMFGTVLAEMGDAVPSFYVRAVTGPLAGKSVCYVCRHGDRPVVLVVLRDLGPQTASLLKDIDAVTDRRRAEGLRCFAVLLTEHPQQDLPRLQTLAFDEKIQMPLTLAHETALQGSPLECPTDAAISVVIYRDQQTVQRFRFKSGECDSTARQSVVTRAEQVGMNR